ncbi:MAG: hypothetical protein ACPGR2_13255 [Psychrobium sp.]
MKSLISLSLTLLLLIGLLFASLLGENHRVDSLIEQYMQQLTTNELPDNCFALNGASSELSRGQCLDDNFILNLSLLEYFGVLEGNFELKIRREQFWMPLVNDTINVSIALSPALTEDADHANGDTVYLTNFFQVARKNGHWRVIGMAINDENLAEIIAQNKTTLNVEKYVKFGDNKFKLLPQTIDFHSLSLEEKHLLKYSMARLLDKLLNLKAQASIDKSSEPAVQ